MRSVYLFIVMFIFSAHTLLAQGNSEIRIYTDFLQKENISAKEYIFKLFEKYDIVILCERDHRDITQYDLLHDIFKDKRFSDNIRNVYFEIGNYAYNDTLNAFLKNRNINDEEIEQSVLSFQRNAYGASLWEKANYSYNIKGVYDINKNLPESKKINVYGLDVGVNWDNATIDDLKLRDSLVPLRDSIMAERMLNCFEKQDTPKALVVLNYRHAFLKDLFGRVNAGRFIAEAHKGKVANVLINSFVLTQDPNYPDNVALAHDGKWDASFLKVHKDNLGFDLVDTPFGNDSFDMIPFPNDFKYKDIFTGFIHYIHFMNIKTVSGITNYIDDRFAPILISRYMLEKEIYEGRKDYNIEELKKEYNTVVEETYKQQFPYLEKDIEKWLK